MCVLGPLILNNSIRTSASLPMELAPAMGAVSIVQAPVANTRGSVLLRRLGPLISITSECGLGEQPQPPGNLLVDVDCLLLLLSYDY